MDASFNEVVQENPESTPGKPDTVSRQQTFQSRGSRNNYSSPSNSKEHTDKRLNAKQRSSYRSGNQKFESQGPKTPISSATSRTDDEWQITVDHSATKGGGQRV